MSQSGAYSTGGGGGGGIQTLTGNTGGPVGPTGGGTVNVVGTGSISVTGNPGTNTLTIADSGGTLTFDADSGSATPSSNTITFAGGTGVSTSATGSTVTINATGIDHVTAVTTSPYVVLSTDYILDVDPSGGPITIQLPDTPVLGKPVIIKDTTGASATNNITVTTVSGSTVIDGSTTYTMAINFLSIQTTGNIAGGYDISLGYNPGAIATITGDTSSITGSSVSIKVNSFKGDFGTAQFVGNGTTQMGLAFSDAANDTGIGLNSLVNVTSPANGNVALGDFSGNQVTTGANNTYIGAFCASSATTGNQNSHLGALAGSQSVGFTGSDNLLLGFEAGNQLQTTESENIFLNTQGVAGDNNTLRIGAGTGASAFQLNKSFISGIQTIVVTGTPVLVSTSDQLGVAVSSKRFKNDVQTMKDESSAIYNLRPVSFVWNKDSSPGLKDALDDRQLGLIAEEVNEVMPSLVNFDKDNKPFSVKYENLSVLLLNELQKLKKSNDELLSRIAALEAQKGA